MDAQGSSSLFDKAKATIAANSGLALVVIIVLVLVILYHYAKNKGYLPGSSGGKSSAASSADPDDVETTQLIDELNAMAG